MLKKPNQLLPSPFNPRKKVSFSADELIVDNEHNDAHLTDAQMDYGGTKLATGSTDNTVRIFCVEYSQYKSPSYHKTADLTGYDGQVRGVAWSHPKFYRGMLVTACYSGRIIIWKEAYVADNSPDFSRWEASYNEVVHSASVNSVAWCAPEFGALVAAGGSDGSISLIRLVAKDEDEDTWIVKMMEDRHKLGCNAVSWSPQSLRLASGGCDNTVKIYTIYFNVEGDCEWNNELAIVLNGHSDWVISVQWSPVEETLISTGQDGKIVFWSVIEEPEKPRWNHSSTSLNISFTDHPPAVKKWIPYTIQTWDMNKGHFSVSWDSMGTFLFVVGEKDQKMLWKRVNKEWKLIEESS